MDVNVRALPRGSRLVAAAGTLCLLATGGVVLVASSGPGTPGAPGVSTPVQSNARDSVTQLDTSATPITGEPAAPAAAEPVPPDPAPSPDGPAAAGGDAPAGPAPSEASVPSAPATFILVCQTPPVLVDGIETSSQVATRVPEGTPIPAGCYRA